MKIVVIGGSGLIGTKFVKRLREVCHEVMAVSTASGATLGLAQPHIGVALDRNRGNTH